MDDMNKFYTDQENGVYKVVRVNQVPPCTVSAARYQEQGYHRVLVVRHMNKSKVELFYIYFCTTAVQKLRQVRVLLEELYHHPYYKEVVLRHFT